MKCQICKTNEAEINSIVCSDNCNNIRLSILNLTRKYTPTNGCANCWGDLGGRCSEECKKEFEISGQFVGELYDIIELAFDKKE